VKALKAIQRSCQRLVRIKKQVKWKVHERITRQVTSKENKNEEPLSDPSDPSGSRSWKCGCHMRHSDNYK
ncbi:MAG: hypothetical protein WCF03_06795, partial [Nitrososphaeraceae archaeon]